MKFKFISLLNVVALASLLVFATSCDPKEGKSDDFYDPQKSISVGYCSNTLTSGIGLTQQTEMGAAILLPVSKLQENGTHITAVRVAVMGEATDCKMFIRRGSVDGADVISKSFTPIIGTWTYIALDEPLEISGDEDYYIGYTLNGSGYLLGYTSSSAYSTKDFVGVSGQWSTLASNSLAGRMAIQAMMLGGDYSSVTPQTDLGIASISAPKYVKVNGTQTMSCILINNGVNSVSSINLSYTYAGNTQMVVIPDVNLMNGATYEYVIPITSAPATAQNTSIDVTVSATNDEVSTNNTISKDQLIYDQSFERTILVEQFTGQACGYCPSGTVTISNALADYEGRYTRVAHHVGYNEDNFTITASTPLTALYNSTGTFAPAVAIDRTDMRELGADGPVMSTAYMTSSLVAEMLQAPSLASVNIARTYNETTRELSLTITGEILEGVTNPRINVYIVQDGIVATQSNGGSDYVHNRAIRASLATDNWGDVIAVDDSSHYSVNFTYTVPTAVGQFDCVATDMDVIAFVTDHNSSILNRKVLNSAEVTLVENNTPSEIRTQVYDFMSKPVLSSMKDACYLNR